ncbi:MAG: energy transducer TonB [Gemmatimonadaceae bacterium]
MPQHSWNLTRAADGASAGFSIAFHGVLVTLWALASEVDAREAVTEHAQRVAYLPPPDPSRIRDVGRESLRYVDLGQPVLGAIDTDLPPMPRPFSAPARAAHPGDANGGGVAEQSSEDAGTGAEIGLDSVFTTVEVDSAAVRLPGSAAPAYPPTLLNLGIEGMAIVQFIVDTAGRADVASFFVISTTHPEFAQSIRDALPGMKFSAARIGVARVRQVVELPLRFNIAKPVVAESVRPDRPLSHDPTDTP